MKKIIGGIVAFLSIALLLAVPKAEAHTLTASSDCNHIEWNATNFGAGTRNYFTLVVDGELTSQSEFKSSTSGTWPLAWGVNHSWSITIDAPGTEHDKKIKGSTTACVPETTTTTTTLPPATTTTVAEPVCQEDEPCWDCTTMGNQICGTPAVVTPPVITADPIVSVTPIPTAPRALPETL